MDAEKVKLPFKTYCKENLGPQRCMLAAQQDSCLCLWLAYSLYHIDPVIPLLDCHENNQHPWFLEACDQFLAYCCVSPLLLLPSLWLFLAQSKIQSVLVCLLTCVVVLSCRLSRSSEKVLYICWIFQTWELCTLPALCSTSATYLKSFPVARSTEAVVFNELAFYLDHGWSDGCGVFLTVFCLEKELLFWILSVLNTWTQSDIQ